MPTFAANEEADAGSTSAARSLARVASSAMAAACGFSITSTSCTESPYGLTVILVKRLSQAVSRLPGYGNDRRGAKSLRRNDDASVAVHRRRRPPQRWI